MSLIIRPWRVTCWDGSAPVYAVWLRMYAPMVPASGYATIQGDSKGATSIATPSVYEYVRKTKRARNCEEAARAPQRAPILARWVSAAVTRSTATICVMGSRDAGTCGAVGS